jgi:hypothetical protein
MLAHRRPAAVLKPEPKTKLQTMDVNDASLRREQFG